MTTIILVMSVVPSGLVGLLKIVAVFEYSGWLVLLLWYCLGIIGFFGCVGICRETFGGLNELDGVLDVVRISEG